MDSREGAVVYDDDRDTPYVPRIQRPGRRGLFFRRSRADPPSRGNEQYTRYRCPGVKVDGGRCTRTKLGDPNFVCQDHIGQTRREARRRARG